MGLGRLGKDNCLLLLSVQAVMKMMVGTLLVELTVNINKNDFNNDSRITKRVPKIA